MFRCPSDTVGKSLTVLKQATDTGNHTVTECDGESGELEILEHYVKKVKDWNDDTKVPGRDFRIPVPAAG